MPRLQYKRFEEPDEVRTFPRGHAQVVTIDESTVGYAVYQPGWHWAADMPAIAGTPYCQLHHLGYSISGTMHVVLDDGPALDIPPGSVYEIPPGHDAWVVGDEPWATVEWTSARTFGIGPRTPGASVLATVLFTDIVDSTAKLQAMGDAAWRGVLLDHNRRLREEMNVYRGREVATTGDGFLAVFDSATRTVGCAAAMTEAARQMGLSIRAGIHTGEVEFVGNDARGLAVHVAARVTALAGADEVLMSSTTHALLEGAGLTLEDAGLHTMKGLTEPRRIFRLVSATAP